MVIFLVIFSSMIVFSVADDVIKERYAMSAMINDHAFVTPEIRDIVENKSIENVIEKMESIAATVKNFRREEILSVKHLEELHTGMVEILGNLTELFKSPLNAYTFLNANGVGRIITPIIEIDYEPLKKQLLIFIKTLFNVASTTTNDLIPISLIDKLVDIFEHDDNLALKAHALDIMYIWLPNNPKIQARVMKLKGLDPFYQQVSKLDNRVIHTMLELFNKILEEHIKSRGNKSQRNRDDYETIKLYRMIGLIERMSTPRVCNGLLNILEALLTSTDDDGLIPSSVFELVKNIKPFCLKLFKGKDRAIKLFDVLKHYVADPRKAELTQNLGLNMIEMKLIVEDFAKNIKENVRDEF